MAWSVEKVQGYNMAGYFLAIDNKYPKINYRHQ